MIKTKRLVSLFLVFVVAAAAMCLGTTAFAENIDREKFFSEDSFINKNICIQEKTPKLSSESYAVQVNAGLNEYAFQLKDFYKQGPALTITDDIKSPDTNKKTDSTYKEYRDENVYFNDEAEIFSTAQRKEIIDMLKETSAAIGFNLAVYAGGQSRTDSVIEEMATSGAEQLFSFDKYYGTIFLYIDMDGLKNAYDYMFCAKDAFLYYPNGDHKSDKHGSEDRIDKILEAMERSFPRGGDTIIPTEILRGLKTYCSELKYYKNEGLCENTWYRDYEKGEYVHVFFGKISRGQLKPYTFLFPALFIAVIAGFLIALIVSVAVKSRYKFKNPASASLYTSSNMMLMRDSQDVFLGAHTTRVKLQSSSGGGGHSGGGGGGHSGGGGGRHR